MAITLDRTKGGIVIICNERGGVNIEQQEEGSVKSFFVDVHTGLTEETLKKIAAAFNIGHSFDD